MVGNLPEGFVYELSPIDWWHGWVTPAEAMRAVEHDDFAKEAFGAELEALQEHARRQFMSRTLWEGDVAEGPYVAGIPPASGNADSELIFCLKQSNNGTVFVWSPYELPWLKSWQGK